VTPIVRTRLRDHVCANGEIAIITSVFEDDGTTTLDFGADGPEGVAREVHQPA
jgi:hypothetical protein